MTAMQEKNVVIKRELRLPQELAEAIDQLALADRRSKNQVTVFLLEEALTKRGYWPPETPTPQE